MSDRSEINKISDEQVRTYVNQNLDAMVADAQTVLMEIKKQPSDVRERIHDDAALDFAPSRLMPETKAIDLQKIKKAILRGVWNVFCNVSTSDPTKGEPDKTVMDAFNKDGVGAELIKAAIIAAFTAIGGVWAGFAAFLAGTLGKKLQDWIIGVICSQLDAVIEKKLTAYCKIVPAK